MRFYQIRAARIVLKFIFVIEKLFQSINFPRMLYNNLRRKSPQLSVDTDTVHELCLQGGVVGLLDLTILRGNSEHLQ